MRDCGSAFLKRPTNCFLVKLGSLFGASQITQTYPFPRHSQAPYAVCAGHLPHSPKSGTSLSERTLRRLWTRLMAAMYQSAPSIEHQESPYSEGPRRKSYPSSRPIISDITMRLFYITPTSMCCPRKNGWGTATSRRRSPSTPTWAKARRITTPVSSIPHFQTKLPKSCRNTHLC